MNPPRHDTCRISSPPNRPSCSYRRFSRSWFGRVWPGPCPYDRWHTSPPSPSFHTSGHTCTSRPSPGGCCDRTSPSRNLTSHPRPFLSARRCTEEGSLVFYPVSPLLPLLVRRPEGRQRPWPRSTPGPAMRPTQLSVSYCLLSSERSP